ncbi:S41 family peptidase [Candidatus Cyanaurora vandensis]|uniref:S41 family peptidase n=1 Tax=Candidatus Cyanaurora vandensis TaxID=2714958 RepID=UPI00257AE307|nr:S41 family peptidase [Candidatus Cyanaurora vandensis]
MRPHHLAASLVLITFLSACGSTAQTIASGNPNASKLIQEVWQIINRDYVDGTFNSQDWWQVRKTYLAQAPNSTTATYQAVAEMVGSLKDPYTRFLRPKDYQQLQTQVSGELSGVGLQIALAPETNELTVIAPIEGSPAYRADLKPRDIILAIDGNPTKGMDLDVAAEKLRGAAGSKVTLMVRRETREFTVALVRAKVEINPVRSEVKTVAGVPLGYIRLPAFNGNATAEVKRAIQGLERKGVQGYVLDLRLNGGGLLGAGVDVAKLWLPAGKTIVATVTRKGVRDATRSSPLGPLTTKPLVLLVDNGTASASEILAGALQDNKRAQLVGTRTFGKGLIQQVYSLADGSGLAVSIAKYQTPAGRDIHKVGIEPDVKVELPADFPAAALATAEDPQYLAATRILTQVAKS